MDERTPEEIAQEAYGGVLPARNNATVTLAIGVKRCSSCKQWRSTSEFGVAKDRGDGLNTKCLDCCRSYQADWHGRPGNEGKRAHYSRASRTSDPERDRATRLRARCAQFGITLTDYQRMYDAQAGRCAICDMPEAETGRQLSIDHDHACCPSGDGCCGRCVRALLCSPCNVLVGYAESEKMQMALGYIARFNPNGPG